MSFPNASDAWGIAALLGAIAVLTLAARGVQRFTSASAETVRKLLHVGVREGSDHDAVDIPREHACGVLDRLTASELDVPTREKQGMRAELKRADLEGHTRARTALREDHGKRPTGQRPVGNPSRLEIVGKIKQLGDLIGREIRYLQEVLFRHDSPRK